MRLSTTLCVFFLLLFSCKNERSIGSKLYDELNNITRASWSKLRTDISNNEVLFELNVGDSIKLNRPQLLLTHYTDSTLYGGEGFYLSVDDIIVILEVNGLGYKVKTEDASVGYISQVWLLDDVSDGSYLFRYKLDIERAIRKHEEAIETLKSEYNLSDEEFGQLLAEEHFKRTGEVFFSYN